MRYECRNLKDLIEAVAEASGEDRIVIFTQECSFRFRLLTNNNDDRAAAIGFKFESCDLNSSPVPQSTKEK